MAVEARNNLQSFHQFVAEQLANGGVQLSPEQVLATWRERLETIEAVREGLDAVDAARTKPLDEFARDFRKRHKTQSQRSKSFSRGRSRSLRRAASTDSL